MKLLLLLLASFSVLAQPAGEPSPTVRQQQEQADHARKQHPRSTKPKEPRAPLKAKDSQGKPPRPKPGEAALRTPSK